MFNHLKAAFVLLFLTALPFNAAFARCTLGDTVLLSPAEEQLAVEQAVGIANHSGRLYAIETNAGRSLLFGTMHSVDPTLTIPQQISDAISTAQALLIEITSEDQADMQAEMARDPSLFMNLDGPGLREQLSQKDWERLATALRPFGIPPEAADQLQPWFASTLIAIPFCELQLQAGGQLTLDQQIEDLAETRSIPVRALESPQDVFAAMSGMSAEDEVLFLQSALATQSLAEPLFADILNLYTQGRIAEIETRSDLIAQREAPEAALDTAFDAFEQALLVDRNANWLPTILENLDAGPTVIAVGALHLTGGAGLVALLRQEGYTVERIVLEGETRP